MNSDNIPEEVPGQFTGAESNTLEEITHSDNKAAREHFNLSVKKLLDVPSWGKNSAGNYALFDQNGKEIIGPAQKGNYIRIGLPAPGNQAGDGFDWVKIISMDEAENSFSITVRPCSNPLNNDESTAHLYSELASNTFSIMVKQNKVIGGVFGRNEKANTEAKSILDKARNIIVSAGARLGLANANWKMLLKGLLKQD